MLEIFDITNSEKWDAIVRSFSSYDVYWLSGYTKAFQTHGDGEPILLYYEDDGIRGINVVMLRDIADSLHFRGRIPEKRYFDIVTPYGYGGWLMEGDATDRLFKAYSAWAEDHHIVSEFVRFHPMVQNHKFCTDFYDVVQLGEVVHMDISDRNRIWENLSSKNRNVIRKAINNQVKIYNGRFPQIFGQFREIYNKTMDKDHAEDYYYFNEEFYWSILEDLPENAQVFFAEKDGLVIAASIILAANGHMNYHLSGSLREYSTLAPTNLLLYKAALWGNANGYKTLYLGGGVGSGEDSLFRFKRAFYRGELNHFYIGEKVLNQEVYDQLLGLREQTDSSFFPKYRA